MKSFSFKSVTPFQTEFETPVKKNNKPLRQQSVLLNDTDITSDDEEQLYTRNPKQDSSFPTDDTPTTETFSKLEKSKTTNTQHSTATINVQPYFPPTTHCSQRIPFYDPSFFK